MALWDTYPEPGTEGPTTWDMLVEHSSVDELTNDAYTHLENQLGGGVGHYVLYDGLEIMMEDSCVDVELNLSPVDVELSNTEFDVEIDIPEYEVEVCV